MSEPPMAGPAPDAPEARVHAPGAPAALAGAPAWRREPYRVLFPLGALLAWAGVLHWLLTALGWAPSLGAAFHAQAQIQGFMTCFAVGFLFTAIPRRTATAPPAAWEMAVAILAPVITVAGAWVEHVSVAQAAWIVLALTLVAFAVRRFLSRSAGRRPPASFVWVPLALLMGIGGSVAAGIGGARAEHLWWLHEVGRGVLLEGMFVALIVGVGGLAIPLITRGEAPPDAAGRRGGLVVLGHVAAAILLVATFWIEKQRSAALGLGLRAAIVLGLLLASARCWRLPTRPGLNGWLVWLSAWMLPAGYGLAAAYSGGERTAALHVVFIGGFALMALAVSAHVTLSHGGHKRLLERTPWQIPAMGAALLAAAGLRTAMGFFPEQFGHLLGASAAAFLLGTLCWGSLVVRALRRPTAEGRSGP